MSLSSSRCVFPGKGENGKLSLRRSLALGGVGFVFVVLVMPLVGSGFGLHFAHGLANQDLRAIVTALFCLILAFPLGMAFGRAGYLLITMPDDNRPIDFVSLAKQAWQFVIKPRGTKEVETYKPESKPEPQPASQPAQFTYQPQQINVEFKEKRHLSMPHLPGGEWLSPQAWAGRWMALLVLAWTQVTVWTGYDPIRNNEWRGLPTDDRATAFYAAFAIMAFSFIMFLRSRKQIDLHARSS